MNKLPISVFGLQPTFDGCEAFIDRYRKSVTFPHASGFSPQKEGEASRKRDRKFIQ